MAASRKPRAERRATARSATKDIKERERLAQLLPGGAPWRPIEVISASLVEPKARSLPCVVCGAGVRVLDHTAKTLDGTALRLATTACPSCGHERVVYFRIEPPRLN